MSGDGATDIGIGLIGAGLMGYRHGMAINTFRGARVTAVVDLDFERAEQLARKLGAQAVSGSEELLSRADVDAVIIAVPDDDHLEPTLQAIEHRKHILLEKPLATSLEDGQRILVAAEFIPRPGVYGWSPAEVRPALCRRGRSGRQRQDWRAVAHHLETQ